MKKFMFFDEGVMYGYLVFVVSKGVSVKIICLIDEFLFEDYNDKYNDRVMLLLVINKEGKSYIFINGNSIEFKFGWWIISLVLLEEDK